MPDAHTEVVWQHVQQRLRGFIARRVRAGDVDDVLQEVLLRMHRNLPHVKQHERLDAWMFQITRNVIIDLHRRRIATPEIPAALPEGTTDVASADGFRDADHGREAEELSACLRPMIAALPRVYRHAIRMTDIEGLTQKEAASRAGVSFSGMKSRVQRARERLRVMLEECCRVELDRRGGIVAYEQRGIDTGCGCGSTSRNEAGLISGAPQPDPNACASECAPDTKVDDRR